jgi:hypothetical protein
MKRFQLHRNGQAIQPVDPHHRSCLVAKWRVIVRNGGTEGSIAPSPSAKIDRQGGTCQHRAFPVKLKTEEPNFQLAHIISWDHARYAAT